MRNHGTRAVVAFAVGVIAVALVGLGATPASAGGGGGKAAETDGSLTYVTYSGQVVTCPVSVVVRLEDDQSASSDAVSSSCTADIYDTLSYNDQSGHSTYSGGEGINSTEEYVGVPTAYPQVKTSVNFEFRDCNPGPSTAGCSLYLTATAPK